MSERCGSSFSPNRWIRISVGELVAQVPYSLAIGPFGSNLKVIDYRDEGVPLVFVRQIRRNDFGGADTKYVTEDKARTLAAHSVDGGDLLVTKMGEPPGDTAVYPQDRPRAIITADCIKVRPDTQLTSSAFLRYAFQEPETRAQILAETKGVAQQKLSLKRFETVTIGVPPIREQEAIIAELERYLSKLDAAIWGLKRAQVNLKRYRASVLKAAVEGRLVPTEASLAKAEGRMFEPASELLARILKERRARWEASELASMRAKGKLPKNDAWKSRYEEPLAPDTKGLPGLPGGWCWATVDQLGTVQGGIQKGKKRHGSPELRDVPYLRVANVQRGFLDLSEVKTIPATPEEIESLRLHTGDVLFNEGGDRDKLGRGWVWNNEVDECIHQNHVFRARLFTPEMRSKFLSWYGNGTGQKYFFDEGKQTTNLASLNSTKLRSLPVPVPPASEQRRIEAEMERLLSEIDSSEHLVDASVVRCSRLRQSILKWAFEGKLVDQDPSDEPASALLERIRSERSAAISSETPRTKKTTRFDSLPAPVPSPKPRGRKKAIVA